MFYNCSSNLGNVLTQTNCRSTTQYCQTKALFYIVPREALLYYRVWMHIYDDYIKKKPTEWSDSFREWWIYKIFMLCGLCLAWVEKKFFNSRSGAERILPIYHEVVCQSEQIWSINRMLQSRLDTLAITFWRSSATVYFLYDMQCIQTILLMNEENINAFIKLKFDEAFRPSFNQPSRDASGQKHNLKTKLTE